MEVPLQTWNHGSPDDYTEPDDVVLNQSGEDLPGTCADCGQLNMSMSGCENDSCLLHKRDNVNLAAPREPDGTTSQNQEDDHVVNDVLPSPPASPVSVNVQISTGPSVSSHVLSQMQKIQTKDDEHQQHSPHGTSPQLQRRQRRRNDRGLLSTTGISNVIDNRYMVLNLPAEETAHLEPPIKPVRRSNFTISHSASYHGKRGPHLAGNGRKNNRPAGHRPNGPTGYENCTEHHHSYQHSSREHFAYDYIDQDDNLEDLDDIPAYDDIPYALFITGSLDETTIKKAKQKQFQRMALEKIQKGASLKSRTKGISNNKNLGYSNDRKSHVTYPAQNRTSIETNMEENVVPLDESLPQTGGDSLVIKSVKLQNQSMNDNSNQDDKTSSHTKPISPYESAQNLMKTIETVQRDIYAPQSSRKDTDCERESDNDTAASTNSSFEQMLSFAETGDKKGDSGLTDQGPLTEKMVSVSIRPKSPTETLEENDKEVISPQTSQKVPNIETNAHCSSETNAVVEDTQNESSGPLMSPRASDIQFIRTKVEASNGSLEGSDGFGNESNFTNRDNDKHEGGPIASTLTSQHRRQFAESSPFTVHPNLLISHHDAQGDNVREIAISSISQKTMVNPKQSISKEINLEADTHSCALDYTVSSTSDISNPISKATHDDHNANEHPVQRKETENEKFIRLKRLERLEAMNVNAQQQNAVQNKSDDHRNKTVHIDGTIKPVKAKVFKNRTSSFGISELPSDADKNPFCAASNDRKQQYNDRSDDKEFAKGGTNTDQTHDGQNNMKTRVGIFNGSKLLENKTSYPNEETRQPKTQNVKPSAMKLLQSRPMMSTSESPDKHEEKSSNDYSAPKLERSPKLKLSMANYNQQRLSPNAYGKTKQSQEKKPATMRLLERMKKQPSQRQNLASSILSLLGGYEDNELRPKATKVKDPTGKNKNVTTRSVNISKANKVVSETKNDDQDVKPSTKLSNSFQAVEEKASSAAERRHEAFRILAADHSRNQIKCSACGRPECEGQSVRQMRGLVRMAKENGFDIRDVSPDGNCMFAAVVDQLNMYGDSRFDSKSLREAAVSWLIEHPRANDGTHYSNFISGNWESYLQKMFAEGEWGDHVVLRALVEIVGHIVKVFHVSGDTSHWTVLEPSNVDVSKDGIHLVLGHVGEFHYTSLRPSDTTPSYIPPTASPSEVLEEKHLKEIKLEGGETIDMFRNDYIDAMSNFPACHFSYLLKTVIPMKYVDDAAICSSHLIDTLQSQYRDTPVVFHGPAADGVFHNYLFTDMQSEVDTNAMIEAYVLMESIDTEHSSIIVEGIHPGFVKLAISPFGLKTNHFYPSSGNSLPIGTQYSQKTSLHYNFTSLISMSFKSWPDMAQSWISRVRTEGWPCAGLLKSILEAGYTVIPCCHPTSSDPFNECQILFIAAEHKLFHEAISKHQKYCFIMLIALCVQTMQNNKSISYRHFKHVFFYACERIPSEYWETRSGSCVLYLIDMLMRCVKARNLPNYFIENYNMIDHLTDSDIRDLEERLELLRSQPVLFLKNINANLERHNLIDSIIDRVSRDVPSFLHQCDMKSSVLKVFVPATIDLARGYISIRNYAHGYELLSSAFQERLSISTCDDMVPYQMFLFGAVSGLDLDSLVWFCAYTDKQLEGQLSKSLIRETCGDLTLTAIKNILPPDVCGSFGNIEVPVQFAQTLCSFCSDFARFLFCVHKTSDILPVLQYCHRIFKEKQSGSVSISTQTSQTNFENFNASNMFDIYTAMFYVNRKQGQLHSLRSAMPEVNAVCQQIGTRGAFNCLKYLYEMVGDETNMTAAAKKYSQLPKDDYEEYFINAFNSWPNRGYMR